MGTPMTRSTVTDELARAALARAIDMTIPELRDALHGQSVVRCGHVFTITPGEPNMSYNPLNTYDRHRHRHACFGGPLVYERCNAMSGGDRCEYRRHRGSHHAAQTGSHLWIEQPLGDCSICGQPVYPLMALSRHDSRTNGNWFASLCCENGIVIVDPSLFDDEPETTPGPDPFGASSEWSSR